MALVALIVEEVSGRAFQDYVRDAILEPLGMQRSGFLLEGEIAENLATPYAYIAGVHQRKLRDCVNTWPSGNLPRPAATWRDFSWRICNTGGRRWENPQ